MIHIYIALSFEVTQGETGIEHNQVASELLENVSSVYYVDSVLPVSKGLIDIFFI